MFKSIVSLSQSTLIYGVGKVLARIIPFLLLPALTNLLPPDQFGVQILYYILIAIAMEIVRLGLDIALLRYYVPEKDPEKRKVIFSTLFWTGFIVTGLMSGLLYFGAEIVTRLIVEPPVAGAIHAYPDWMFYTLRLCAGIIWMDNMAAFPLTVMRGENRPRAFITITLIGVTFQTALTLYLLFGLRRGIQGIFEANLLASTLVFALTMPTVMSRLKLIFSKAVFISCLMFGLPNVPNVLFVQVIELSDRKILELLRSATEVGIYSAGYKLGMFLSIVAMGFRLAWQPFFLQIKDQSDAKDIYGRVLTYYLAMALWIYLLLTAFIEPLATWTIPIIERPFIAQPYWPGIAIFPIIGLAHLFNGLFAVFVVGIYIKKKMKALPYITGIAAIFNIVGNMMLVPVYGMWASAWMTVVSYALMAILLHVYVQRVYYIRYEWRRVLHICAAAGLVFVAGELFRNNDVFWIGYMLSFLYPVLLLLSGAASKSELSRIGLAKR